MMKKNLLAIIIPAYKTTFLREALGSIAAQTCQDFTLYVGDDHSPHPIEEIVKDYLGRINLVYKRFDENLGGRDLVAHWKRCIEMSEEEPYIWLFSDDDVMESRCVEDFYKHLSLTRRYYDLYHFNVQVIDENSKLITIPKHYPQRLDCFSFYKGKMKGRYMSLVVENIFTREVYSQKGGFLNFDLAWGSDTATWIRFSEAKGIYTINNSYILWRRSSQNISPDMSGPIAERKVKALLDFFDWTYTFFKLRKTNCFLTNIRAFINRMSSFRQYVSKGTLEKSINRFCEIHKCPLLRNPLYFFIKYRQ